MKIVLDADLCTGSGMCALIAPTIFELPQGSTIANVLVASTDDPELMRLAREAEGACPTGAITVTTDD